MTGSNEQKPIAVWLLICCAAVFAMVILGGVTRLMGSGLSMVEWEPVTGILPPLNQKKWTEVFELYQQFPEYKKKNAGMSLAEFKSIYWWEYAHRLLGRLIGVLFFVPLVLFIIAGRVSRDLAPKLVLMFVLGGLQGLLGWYMVKSGLVQDPHVSQYRLAAHLGLAFVIYVYMLWVALGLLYPARENERVLSPHRSFSIAISLLVFITALSGAFVAGTRAGLSYNTFPTMGGQWLPAGMFTLEPLWRNFFENVTTIQFDHRVLATILFGAILVFWLGIRKTEATARVRFGAHLLLVVVCVQVALGIATLLLRVPTVLAAAHQAGALLLLTVAVFVTHQLRAVSKQRLELGGRPERLLRESWVAEEKD